MDGLKVSQECTRITQEYSCTEISFLIEELREYVNRNAISKEVAERANGTLQQYRLQQAIDEAFHYGLTHLA